MEEEVKVSDSQEKVDLLTHFIYPLTVSQTTYMCLEEA